MRPFNADNIALDKWESILKVRKKPIVVHAVQLNFPEGFKVTTKEGEAFGKPGDYLMFDVKSEKFLCDKEKFEKSYDIIEHA